MHNYTGRATASQAIKSPSPDLFSKPSSKGRNGFLRVPLDEELRIESDASNFMLQRLVGFDKLGKPRWRTIGYYSSLTGALECAADELVRRKGERTLIELCFLLHDLTHRIRRICQECELQLVNLHQPGPDSATNNKSTQERAL